jgi:hypothetical protein
VGLRFFSNCFRFVFHLCPSFIPFAGKGGFRRVACPVLCAYYK